MDFRRLGYDTIPRKRCIRWDVMEKYLELWDLVLQSRGYLFGPVKEIIGQTLRGEHRKDYEDKWTCTIYHQRFRKIDTHDGERIMGIGETIEDAIEDCYEKQKKEEEDFRKTMREKKRTMMISWQEVEIQKIQRFLMDGRRN